MGSIVESRGYSPTDDPLVDAEALFASALQCSANPTDAEIAAAVSQAIRELGLTGCSEHLAQEYGDHPTESAARMRWALLLAAHHAAV